MENSEILNKRYILYQEKLEYTKAVSYEKTIKAIKEIIKILEN